eukprot:399669_1
MTQKHEHKQVILEYETQIAKARVSAKDTAQKILEKINKKIGNKFKLENQYKLCINEESIKSNDFISLERILSSNKPPITIKIIKNIQNNGGSFTLKIYHNNKSISSSFALNPEIWNENMLYNLKVRVKNEFKITSKFSLCEDEDRELELDDIDDMKSAFDEVDDEEKNSSFVMNLYVKEELGVDTYEELKLIEEEESKDKYDSCTEETFINSCDQSRRKPVFEYFETNNASDDIIQCIGSLHSTYDDKNRFIGSQTYLGTATIISVDDTDNCYVLTAAHNAYQFLRECNSCKIKVISKKCVQCKSICQRIKPSQLVKATKISFTLRCTKKEVKNESGSVVMRFGDEITTYDIKKYSIRETLYQEYSSGNHGYDICVMKFKCKNHHEANKFRKVSENIKLVTDETFGANFNANLHIFGYPGDKTGFNQCYMYGMSSEMDGTQFKVEKHEQTGQQYIVNKAIDTQPGQSGALIWSYLEKDNKRFRVYGVHTAGKQKGKSGVNFGTFLDNETVLWIHQSMYKLSLKDGPNSLSTQKCEYIAQTRVSKTRIAFSFVKTITTRPKSSVLCANDDEKTQTDEVKEEKKKVCIRNRNRNGKINRPQKLVPNNDHKIVILCGRTGAGKTTLINAMVNYIYGIKQEDKCRLKLINEKQKCGGNADSHTDHVTSYRIEKTMGCNINYNLTIIDTPGFGDTRGISKDEHTCQEYLYVFSEILTAVNGICFVVKASDNRLDPSQRYIFNQMLNLWGNDVRKNIFFLMTFADGGKPNCSDALDTLEVLKDIDCKQKLKMNNSAFTANPLSEPDIFNQMFWKMGVICFQNFFSELDKKKPIPITFSMKVIMRRETIKAFIKYVSNQIEPHFKEISQLIEYQKLQQEIDDGEKIIFKMKKIKPEKKECENMTLICTEHQHNCHKCDKWCAWNFIKAYFTNFAEQFLSNKSETIDNAKNMIPCVVFNASGQCKMCKCDKTKHEQGKYMYELTQSVEEESFWDQNPDEKQEIDDKFMKSQQIIQTLDAKIVGIIKDISVKLGIVRGYKNELESFALRPKLTTMEQYIDDLIMFEKNSENRNEQKIQIYKELKKQEALSSATGMARLQKVASLSEIHFNAQ